MINELLINTYIMLTLIISTHKMVLNKWVHINWALIVRK